MRTEELNQLCIHGCHFCSDNKVRLIVCGVGYKEHLWIICLFITHFLVYLKQPLDNALLCSDNIDGVENNQIPWICNK